ncbi:MAG: hypothetical protein NTW95_14365 [Candidatus Aminicenantes bacterium]|nr:hypothetical protein [Candidatus Aminicenantes bacterium]
MSRPLRTGALFFLACLAAACASSVWAGQEGARNRSFVHPQARIQDYPEMFKAEFEKKGVLTAAEAIDRAVEIFRKRGVGRLCICEVTWIAGAVSGYLVDAQGDLSFEGGHYSLFRLGITDSPQGTGYAGFPGSAGAEFVFIAKGRSADGRPLWLPPPGPDTVFTPNMDVSEGMLAYEYLLQRERFETLTDRYPPCPPAPDRPSPVLPCAGNQAMP